MAALLSKGRLAEPAPESVDDGAGLEQILNAAEDVATIAAGRLGLSAFAPDPVGPGHRDERSAAVRQYRQQQRNGPSRQRADDGEAASFEGMSPTGDDERGLRRLEVGSLWCRRLITSTIIT